jgi:hypothetical protein
MRFTEKDICSCDFDKVYNTTNVRVSIARKERNTPKCHDFTNIMQI